MAVTLDLERFAQTPLQREPFPYLIVPHMVRADELAAIHRDYPRTRGAGSFPIAFLNYGPGFKRLVQDLRSEAFRNAISQKFEMDLKGRPSMITARGEARWRDGKIHTDTDTKLITVLIYMNSKWEAAGGCLRLLRSSTNLEDVIAEVPPLEGTMIAFKVSPNSWHGHHPVEGPRRVVQFNYVTHASVVWKEQARHALSSVLKRFQPRHEPSMHM